MASPTFSTSSWMVQGSGKRLRCLVLLLIGIASIFQQSSSTSTDRGNNDVKLHVQSSKLRAWSPASILNSLFIRGGADVSNPVDEAGSIKSNNVTLNEYQEDSTNHHRYQNTTAVAIADMDNRTTLSRTNALEGDQFMQNTEFSDSSSEKLHQSGVYDDEELKVPSPPPLNPAARAALSLNKKRLEFLDSIALVSSFLSDTLNNTKNSSKSSPSFSWNLRGKKNEKLKEEDDGDDEYLSSITPQSDLSLPGRHIHIVTTAALPWFTGTAVNPLLRAAHLHRKTQEINNYSYSSTADGNEGNLVLLDENNNTATSNSNHSRWVTLVIPWLELQEDQEELYGSKAFGNVQEQEDYIRSWLADEAGMADAANPDTGIQILFYPARYHSGLRSIFAMGDIMSIMEPSKMDVCVLEEPEHCNWFRHPGDSWMKRFEYVVGIVHTNYKEYASSHYSGLWTAPAISMLSSAMVRAYCHQVIKLSSVLQPYAPEKEVVSNVHGVRADFLQEGLLQQQRHSKIEDTKATISDNNSTVHCEASGDSSPTQVYFIGKLLWAKGLDIMLELEDYYKQCTGNYFAIDIYGSGPEGKEIAKAYHGRKSSSKIRTAGKTTNDYTTKNATRSVSRINNFVSNLFSGGGKVQVRGKRRGLGNNFRRWRRRWRQRDNEDGRMEDSDGIGETAKAPTSASTILDDQHEEGNTSATDLEFAFPQDFLSRAATSEWADLLPSLDELQVKAKQHLAKVKETITAVEERIPKTFAELRKQPIPATFPGRVDHATLKRYKVFVNPSVSEVLCTTTAEALAMGKFAIIPVHPSNTWFLQFPNCLAYRNKFEFAANLQWALAHEPEPLTAAQARQFSWEAATERLLSAAAITRREALERERLGLSKLDERIAWFHNELGKGATGDILRKICGGGPVSDQVKYQKLLMEQILQQEHKENEA